MAEKKPKDADAELAGAIAEQLLKKYGVIKKGIAARKESEAEPIVKRKSRVRTSIKAVEDMAKEVEQECAVRVRRKRRSAVELAAVGDLPTWRGHVFGAPNELIRSALFAAIDVRNREFQRRETIMVHGGTVISFTGTQLTQAHLDVYEGVLHLMRGSAEGTRVHFTAHELLKLIDRQTGKREYSWLDNMIYDLIESVLSIEDSNGAFFRGSLIASATGDLKHGDFLVEVTRQLINLFSRGFTHVEWEQRWKLKRKPLACWLHLYYCSHSEPFPVTVEFLRTQSGSKAAELKEFRRALKAALDEIKEIGVIDSWSIEEGDKVAVTRPKQKKTNTK
jgi:TrfA protein